MSSSTLRGHSRAARASAHGSGAHGYVRHVGLEPRRLSLSALLRRVREGLPFESFTRFQQAAAFTAVELCDVIRIPERTLHRRKAEGRLAPDESDRLLRLARIFELALRLFDGDAAAAKTWLGAPQRALDGARPIELAASDAGAREVEQLVGRLEHGVIA